MNEELKILISIIVSTGSVPEKVTIDTSEYINHEQSLKIENFISTHSDSESKAYILGLLDKG